MAAHRYWRVYIPDETENYSAATCARLTMATSAGGSNVCSGGTPISGAYQGGGSGQPSNAFDGSNSTIWWANGKPNYLGYDFGGGGEKDIVEVSWMAQDGTNYWTSPRVMHVQYSDDGSSWATKWVWTLTVWVSDNEVQTTTYPASLPALTGGHRYWRIKSTGQSDLSSSFRFGGVEAELFVSPSGGTNIASLAIPYSSDVVYGRVSYLINGDVADASIVSTNLNTSPKYMAFDFGPYTPVIRRVDWTARGDSDYREAPAQGALEYSDDGSSWTEAATFSGLTGWTAGQKRTLVSIPITTRTETLIARGRKPNGELLTMVFTLELPFQ